MHELITLALIGAVCFLWTRLSRAERRLEQLIEWARENRAIIEAGRIEVVPPAARPAAPPTAETPAPEPAAEVPQPEADPEPEPQTEREPEPEPLARAIPARPLAESMAYAASEQPSQTAQSEPEETAPPEEESAEEGHTPSGFDFEDIFGRRLPIWAGGIALAIAGIFLVRYAIEAGLFTPVFRVFTSFAFGLGLIAWAEAAFRYEDRVRDPRVRQALAGAGIATLFGAFYLAGTAYGLIGPTLAFVGLAVVTAGAIALSFRFGLPCAVLGLVGGFAAPVMVDSESANVPLLAFYLALVTGGLAWTGQKQGHRWLGYVAIGIGLGWGVLMQLTGLGGTNDLLAVGGYLIVLGTVLPAFLYDREGPGALQIIAGAIATLQMALLVSDAGFAPLTWALYLLIGAALTALGWRFASLRPASAIAAFIGIWLLGIWTEPSTGGLLLVTGLMALIFLAVPLVHQWRGAAGLIDVGQVALGALGLGAVLGYQLAIAPSYPLVGDATLAAYLAVLALFPIAGFVQLWRVPEADGQPAELDLRPASLLLGSAYLLVLACLLLITPNWLAPVMAAVLAVVSCALLASREAPVLRAAAWTAIAVTGLSLLVTPDFENEALRLGNSGLVEEPLRAVIRWTALLPALIAMSLIRANGPSRLAADGMAAVVAYGALAQLVPGQSLAWVAAIGAIAVIMLKPDRFMGWATFFAIALAWSATPLIIWFGGGAMALVGDPFMANEVVTPPDMALRLAPAGLGSVVIALRMKDFSPDIRMGFAAIPFTFALLTLHSGFKQIFGITSLFQFEQYGMAERSVWQALLLAVGYAISQFEHGRLAASTRRIASGALITASLAHFTWFTLLLHNPLITAQNVGPTPVANWLLLAYGIAIAAVLALRPELSRLWGRANLACDIAVMGLLTLLSVSLLRQVFSGPILTETMIGSTESLLLSLLGIALALAFLWWGSRSDQRSWRIGSLVLILIAVLKVFLIDAAGLEGLLRIASFMALGFSLIGIGWVYSRQLAKRPTGDPDAALG
ncbi:MAG: DUF2339 domain-containing protein [Erythrobacter sp.]